MAVIIFDKVSKGYRLGQFGYRTLREDIYKLFSKVIPLKSKKKDDHNYLWALDNVSFEVNEGEVLGIIGPNGAGKTTTLRLLAGVTGPNSGKISVNGSIGVLIDLQAGFHSELTGRENIYLQGSILGMSKREVDKKFDSIVDFSELRSFIDTPVKRYSSGMYVRLGFAIAIHVDPEVLLIDEVLAVGDMAFQRKCFDRIKELKDKAKAVVFVSHNMTSIQAICTKTILLFGGKIRATGTPREVIPIYEKLMLEKASPKDSINEKKTPVQQILRGTGEVEIQDIRLLNMEGNECNIFQMGEGMSISIEYIAHKKIVNPIIHNAIKSLDGRTCCASSTRLDNIQLDEIEGHGRIEIEIPEILIVPGYYTLQITFYDENFDFAKYNLGRNEVEFQVTSLLPFTAKAGVYGLFYQKQNWRIS
ncbi:ABC transporter ATP-binding protein [Chloroflexota bacterium]